MDGATESKQELEARQSVIDRHRTELAGLVGALNRETAANHAAMISTVLAWDKTSGPPHPLGIMDMQIRNAEGDYVGAIRGTSTFAPTLALVNEINAKIAELARLGYSATMAIHKITSAKDPKGRPVVAVMEVAPRSAIVRGDYGTSLQAEVGETLESEGHELGAALKDMGDALSAVDEGGDGTSRLSTPATSRVLNDDIIRAELHSRVLSDPSPRE
jgi:hypothetical protein